MLNVEQVLNNCGVLEVRFCQDDTSVEMINKVQKQVNDGECYYAEFFSDGTVKYGCYVNGKWWSSNSESINDILALKGTKWELQNGSFGVNGNSCGILKSTFNELDEQFGIHDQFNSKIYSLVSAMYTQVVLKKLYLLAQFYRVTCQYSNYLGRKVVIERQLSLNVMVMYQLEWL